MAENTENTLSSANAPHWDIVDRRLLVDRSPYAQIYDEDVRLPDGTLISNWVRVELPPFIIVFALLEDGRVPIVRQYRQAPRDWMLELPAGAIEEGEDHLIAAQRELREEAGVEADQWRYLGKYLMDSNRDCGWGYAYLATGARQAMAPDAGDVGEMTVHLMTLDEVRRRWQAGDFISAPTALTIGLALSFVEKK
ncbi:MAG: NUDIX hydrolase [Anaerolineae bacterium]|nr:NUDIX hydrolase [Anaerolineae bacterium]